MKTKLNPTVYARSLLAILCYRGVVNARSVRWVPFLKLEKEMFYLQKFVTQGQIAIDVGANVGIYTGWLARLVGRSGRVVAFEPYRPAFDMLVSNVRRMHATNVTALNEAVGDVEGRTSLELPKSRLGEVNDPFIHVNPQPSSRGDVGISTIDKIMVRERVGYVNLIKVDVEGYEHAVINGARETIRNFRPLILVEIFDRWAHRYGSDFESVNKTLVDLDYSGFLLERGQLLALRDPPTTSRNLFYVPTSFQWPPDRHSLSAISLESQSDG